MIKHLKQLAGDSLIYGMAGIISKMIGILLIPIYTRIFLPTDYGIINLVNTTFFLLSILVVCALDSAVARWFYDTELQAEQKKSFSAYIWFQVFLAVAISLIVILSSGGLNHLLLKGAGQRIYFILPAITLVTNIFPGVLINWYRLHRRPVSTVIFSISQTLLTIGLTILFTVYLKWHITGVFAAITISTSIFSLIAIIQLRGWLSLGYFQKSRLAQMLRYAGPMIPAAISYWLLNNVQTYLIAFFTKSNAMVGLFGIGVMIASGLTLLTGAFQQAWGPFAFSLINKPDANKIYANVFLMYGYVMGFVAAVLLLFSPEILMVFTTPQYYGSAWVAGILGYNLVLIGFTYIAMIGVSIHKNTAPYGMAMMYATFAAILLSIILIPRFGIEGSAIATVTAQVIVPIYLFYKGQKVYPIPYKFREVFLAIFISAIAVVALRLITFDTLTAQIAAKVSLTILLLFLLLFLNRKPLIRLLSQLRNKTVKEEVANNFM
jgi:O-antigen/teichoic acid export membrane protein